MSRGVCEWCHVPVGFPVPCPSPLHSHVFQPLVGPMWSGEEERGRPGAPLVRELLPSQVGRALGGGGLLSWPRSISRVPPTDPHPGEPTVPVLGVHSRTPPSWGNRELWDRD